MINGKKVAVICGGGGASGAYGVGGSMELQELLGTERKPDFTFGASAGAATAACLATGQAEECRDLWRKEITQEEIMHPGLFEEGGFNYNRWKKAFMEAKSFQEGLDIVFKSWIDVKRVINQHIVPTLDLAELQRTSTEVLLATTNCRTGNPHLFSSKKHFQYFQNHLIFEASMAIPQVDVNPTIVELEGEYHFDGDLALTPDVATWEAINRGAEIIFRFTNSSLHSVATVVTFREAIFQPHVVRGAISRGKSIIKYRSRPLPRGVTVIDFTPSKPLATGTFNNSPPAIEAAINQGEYDVKNHPLVQDLLGTRVQVVAPGQIMTMAE